MVHQFIKAKEFFAAVKNTVYLFKNIWKEGTTTLLHAPCDVDKTETALSIATDLAKQGREVLYINVDDRLDRQKAAETDNLYVFTPQFESIDDESDYAELVFEAIEQAVRTTGIRTIVVDSVSRIAALSFGKNASAAYIMKRLVALQMKCKLSILAVANDTTKSANNALLTLAASEITIDADAPAVESRAAATAEQTTEIAPDKSDGSPTGELTRQQRRALKRRMAKHPERYRTA